MKKTTEGDDIILNIRVSKRKEVKTKTCRVTWRVRLLPERGGVRECTNTRGALLRCTHIL